MRDFEDEGQQSWLVLREKGGKERRIPCHHLTCAHLREYPQAAALQRRLTASQALQIRPMACRLPLATPMGPPIARIMGPGSEPDDQLG